MHTVGLNRARSFASVSSAPLRVAIIGSGKIGSDLLSKVIRSSLLECALFVGRDHESEGLRRARGLGISTSADGLAAIETFADEWQLLLDATSASAHRETWRAVESFGKPVIDLTPSRIGMMVVPALDMELCRDWQNINLITCGGQAAVPIATAMTAGQPAPERIHVVSTVAAESIGPATLHNIDDYYLTTKRALSTYTGCHDVSAELIVDSSSSPAPMRTEIAVEVRNADVEIAQIEVTHMVGCMQRWAPGYQVLEPPTYDGGKLRAVVEVTGCGDFLPTYAGNLDIITCAAIAIAEEHARSESSRRLRSSEFAC